MASSAMQLLPDLDGKDDGLTEKRSPHSPSFEGAIPRQHAKLPQDPPFGSSNKTRKEIENCVSVFNRGFSEGNGNGSVVLGGLKSNDTDDELVETRSRYWPNSDVTAPRQRVTPQDQSLASYNNTGTQNMKGLINNSGYAIGNGNGSIIFGSFDSSNRRYNY
ncbi:hypothetical protein TSUD_206790 [Trifolium subterraneum]|uniref:Uncharacterized protein n=1 Tax=Trifolium subterraneum TaxID=3900 RepID=A0A2Z6N5W0_TRISU|nr:hypothetical protein TSUD_206790 [Trifolium subterraneum]